MEAIHELAVQKMRQGPQTTLVIVLGLRWGFVFYFEHFPHPIPFDFRQGRLPFCGALFYSPQLLPFHRRKRLC